MSDKKRRKSTAGRVWQVKDGPNKIWQAAQTSWNKKKKTSTYVSIAEHPEVVFSRASGSCTCFLFFFFFSFTESRPCSLWSDLHCVGVVADDWGFCSDGLVSGWDFRLHMPAWHQSSSWFDASKWDGTHSLFVTFSPSSISLFRFFFFFFRLCPSAASTGLVGVVVAGGVAGSGSHCTSECRRFFFLLFFFSLTFRAAGLSRFVSWAEEPTWLEDLGLFGLALWSPLVKRGRLAFGFCGVEGRGCFWGLCCLKDPLEWAKGGDDWTFGEWNGPALR